VTAAAVTTSGLRRGATAADDAGEVDVDEVGGAADVPRFFG
jgi:hypothetical protein